MKLDRQRDELKIHQDQLSKTTDERQRLSARLDSLNIQIEKQKSSMMDGRQGARSAMVLDELLRESQSVSERLSQKVVEEQTLTEAVQGARERLAAGLDAEIRRLYANWNKTPRQKLRSALVPALRQLYQERKALLSAQFANQTNEAALPKIGDQSAGDPDALLEMADMLLDREDKLRREEKALASHIEQLLNEQELERRLAALIEEDALFDEGERRISLSRSAHILAPEKSVAAPVAIEALSSITTSAPVLPSSACDAGASAAVTPSGAPERQGAMGITDRSDLERLSPGAKPFSGNWAESDSVPALKAHQAYLRALADELHRRAEEAIRQAGELQ